LRRETAGEEVARGATAVEGEASLASGEKETTVIAEKGGEAREEEVLVEKEETESAETEIVEDLNLTARMAMEQPQEVQNPLRRVVSEPPKSRVNR
jgi:hypothetical protein